MAFGIGWHVLAHFINRGFKWKIEARNFIKDSVSLLN